MPDKKPKFKLEDSDRMIKDVIDSFFQEQNVTHDLEELMEIQGGQELPAEIPGSNLMAASEMGEVV